MRIYRVCMLAVTFDHLYTHDARLTWTCFFCPAYFMILHERVSIYYVCNHVVRFCACMFPHDMERREIKDGWHVAENAPTGVHKPLQAMIIFITHQNILCLFLLIMQRDWDYILTWAIDTQLIYKREQSQMEWEIYL